MCILSLFVVLSKSNDSEYSNFHQVTSIFVKTNGGYFLPKSSHLTLGFSTDFLLLRVNLTVHLYKSTKILA